MSSRGGARQGAGRKSEWSSGKTTAIRVPEDLAEEIMMFAKKLDKERRLAAQQKHLTSLLEDVLRVSQEEMPDWIDKLPKEEKKVIGNIDCIDMTVSAKTCDLSKEFQEGETSQGFNTTNFSDVEASIFTIEGVITVVKLSNGYQILLPYQNGKFDYLAGDSPEQKVSIAINDNGEVCLVVSNTWNIHHFIIGK
jgi:hypothetical protein